MSIRITATVCVLALVACSAAPVYPSVDDLAHAAPDPVIPPAVETLDHLAGASKMVALASIASLTSPKPAEGWPYGAATWRPDWSQRRIVGRVAEVPATSACVSRVGRPALRWDSREPVVGELVYLEATTLHLAAPTDWPAVLLVEPDGKGLDFDAGLIGLPGCRLAVDLGRAVAAFPGPAGSLVSRDPGTARIRLEWTPEPEWAGRSVVLQLLVLVPPDVAQSGLLLSPGMRVDVGRR